MFKVGKKAKFNLLSWFDIFGSIIAKAAKIYVILCLELISLLPKFGA